MISPFSVNKEIVFSYPLNGEAEALQEVGAALIFGKMIRHDAVEI